MAEWARLLSECRGNSVAGSNPALPAKIKTRLKRRVFIFGRGLKIVDSESSAFGNCGRRPEVELRTPSRLASSQEDQVFRLLRQPDPPVGIRLDDIIQMGEMQLAQDQHFLIALF